MKFVNRGVKILIVNRLMGIRRGGGEYFDYYIARELQKMGNEVKFIIGKKGKSDVDLGLPDFGTVYISTPYLRDYYYWWEEKRFRPLRIIGSAILDLDLYLFEKRVFDYLKTSDRFEFDLVQLCGLPRLGSWIEEKLQVPTSIIWHGEPSKRGIRWGKQCSFHVGIGAAYPRVRDYIDSNTLQLEPGIDTDVFVRRQKTRIRDLLNLNQDSVVFIFVGRLIPVKNLPFMLEGFYEVLKENSKVHLLIVGDGPGRKSLMQFVKEKGMNKNVTFTGNIEREKVVDYYSAADVFIITSKYESFSLVVLEAMSCSLPLIVSSSGWLPRLIKDGENGKVIDPDDICNLKEAILFMANNKSWRDEVGKRNRNFAFQYSWGKSAFKLISFYREILKIEKK